MGLVVTTGRIGIFSDARPGSFAFFEDQYIAGAQPEPCIYIVAQGSARGSFRKATIARVPGIELYLVVRREETSQ